MEWGSAVTASELVRVGVDIGGTFTDVVVIDERVGTVMLGKTLTTPDNLMDGVLTGLQDVLRRTGYTFTDLAHVVHGTTVVTNAIIERKGVRVGLVTTRGVRDALEMGREFRYDIYDLQLQRPEPLVPRYLRQEVTERVSVDGEVLLPLDLASLDDVVKTFDRHQVGAVAVCLLHAYVDPTHERRVVRELRSRMPGVFVTGASDLVPVMREYERTSTAVANAYVQPMVERYLVDLEQRLAEEGLEGPLYIMLSSGGLASVRAAAAAPVKLIESGPAGGAMAARYVGEQVAELNLISFDMGGTTAKMCLIDEGVPVVTHEFETARVHRFKKGSGLPLKVPVIEMIEIGAGGGSIAAIDSMGLLKVGPRSAGASPGPACYGQGGLEPTVTDADLVLGYLNPDYFLGGRLRLHPDAARAALERAVAPALGRDAVEAAAAVNEVVNQDMATATRLHVAERGRDLRKYKMVAFGGAGPVHAYAVAKLLGAQRLILPYGAGTLSALGFLVAPMAYEVASTYFTAIEHVDWSRLQAHYAAMEKEAREALSELGISQSSVTLGASAEMRFRGQGYEIPVEFPLDIVKREDGEALTRVFHDAYEDLFTRVPGGVQAEALTWRLVATGPQPSVELQFEGQPADESVALAAPRLAYFHELGGFAQTAVYRRNDLPTGAVFEGPALVEEKESTAVIGPRAKVHIDESRNLIIDLP